MARLIRVLLLGEAATFIIAAAIHGGLIVGGNEHPEAGMAETVIAAVLVAAAVLTWIRPNWTRAAGLFGQAFALFGTLVGIVTIAVGVGPQTPVDILYHVAIAGVLVWGLVVARRVPVRQR